MSIFIQYKKEQGKFKINVPIAFQQALTNREFNQYH